MNFYDYLKYLTREQALSLLPTNTKNEIDDEDFYFYLRSSLTEQNLSRNQKRYTWKNAMFNLFFSEMHRCFIFTPSKKYSSTSSLKSSFQNSVRKFLKTFKKNEFSLYVSKIHTKPLQFMIAMSFNEVQNFEEFLDIPLEDQFILYVFPEIGFSAYWPLEKDSRLKLVLNSLGDIFSEVKEVRINALLLRKISTKEKMQKLVISTPPEIAGFSGLDGIEFKGADVMLGLSGLKRRHDAEIDKITKVGPLTELVSESYRLKAGQGVQFKNYDALKEFLKIIKTK